MTTDGRRPRPERDPRELGPLLAAARRAAGGPHRPRGLLQKDVVAATSLSQAQLSRVETGESMLELDEDKNVDQVSELVALYGIDNETADWIRGVVSDHHAERLDDRRTILRGRRVLATQARFRRYEQRAKRIRGFSGGGVLGQVQSPGMVAAIFDASIGSDAVQERLRRGVERPENRDRSYELVMHEAVATWPVGSFAVMAEQFDHLIEVSRLDNVDLRWIPGRTITGLFPGPGFNVYDDDFAVLSQVDGSVPLRDRRDIAQYEERHAAFQRLALADEAARSELNRWVNYFRRAN